MGLLDQLLSSASALTGGHVRVDGKRLVLSDAAFCGGMRRVAAAWVPQLAVNLEPAPHGYLVRATASGHPLEAVLMLDRLRFANGVLRVEVTTPDGVSLASRPVVDAFAAVVGSLFGGTWAGGQLLSLGLPEALRWDGKRATLDVPIDLGPIAGPRLAHLDATAVASRDAAAGTLVLELDREGIASDVVAALFGAAIDRVRPGQR